MTNQALAGRGESSGELLTRSRVQTTARMLASPNLWRLSTAEVGRRAGFKDPSHFAKAFRRLRGLSPGEARRIAQAGEVPPCD